MASRSRKTGRPTLLTPTVEKRLVDAIRLGAPVAIAAASAGIAEQTFYAWAKAGREELEARAEGRDPDPEREPHVKLWEKVVEARAQAALRNIGQIQKAAAGGYVTEEVTRKYRDPETGRLVTETTQKRAPVDWRAAAWWLERQQRAHFGRGAEQVELTGAGGGPVQIAAAIDVQALTQRLREHLATNGSAMGQAPAGAGE
jgi:hypothetical protein